MPKRFSIILPVRNGGEHLKLCVASILAQTRADDFDLFILENGSTDGTAEWLRTLSDPRVQVQPSRESLTIEENWARILEISRGDFMTMIGHDDLLEPTFLEVIHALIQRAPDAGLYQTHFKTITESGDFLAFSLPAPARETDAEFLAARLCRIRDSYGTGYVMRSRDYDRVGGIPPFAKLHHADDALWLRLMAESWKATAPEVCFSYRCHPQSAGASSTDDVQLSSLQQHFDFLENLAAGNPALGDAMARYGPEYFYVTCRNLHRRFLEGALRGIAPYPAEKRERLRRLAERSSGGFDASRLRGRRRVQWLEWCEQGTPHRWMFAALDAGERLLNRLR